jgi:hypothetical protein
MKDELEFRVDTSPVDIGTYVELQFEGGMAFDTPERRDSFFRRAQLEPTTVPYGTALGHATGTNVGCYMKIVRKLWQWNCNDVRKKEDKNQPFQRKMFWNPEFFEKPMRQQESQNRLLSTI